LEVQASEGSVEGDALAEADGLLLGLGDADVPA
jgi:hypothetical protein